MKHDHVELKSLKTQLSKAEIELKVAQRERVVIDKKISNIKGRLSSINEQISKITTSSKKVIVSEHAILRYLERVRGIDIEEVKREIMPDDSREQIEQMGGGKFPVNGSHILIAKNNVIKTITERN